jgi:hypothetical protein
MSRVTILGLSILFGKLKKAGQVLYELGISRVPVFR